MITTEGVNVWNTPEGGAPTISGGSMTGVGTGLHVNNFEGNNFAATRGAFATIDNVTINANTIGIRVNDSPSSTRVAVKATIGTGMTVNGGAQGVSVEQSAAQIVMPPTMAFAGQLGNYIRLVSNTANIDATNYTFEGKTGAQASVAENLAIEDKLVHKQDNAAIGLIRVKTGELFVTANSGSIQRGVDNATTGDIIHIGAGTYAGNLTIGKTLQLRGPNYGINPNTGTRVAEAIVVPATTNTDTASSGSNIVTIAAANVVVDGLTIDGDNTSLAESTVGFVGSTNTSIDAARGVYVSSNGLNNIRVANNVVKNVSSAGIRFQQATNFFPTNAASIFSSGHMVDGNRVENIGSTGIDVRNSMYTAITNNVVNNARYGVYVNSFRISNQAGSEYQEIAGNTITARQMGIWMNLYAAEPFTIRNNSISAVNTGEFTKWYGVMLSTISTPQNMVNQVALPLVSTPERWALSDNSISGSGVASSTQGYGYWLWSVDNNQTADGTAHVGSISGGSVSGVDVGLFMHNVDTDAATNYGIARTGAHARIANVAFTVNAGGMGLQIKDSASWATANIAPLVAKRNVSVTVGSGITINGGAKGVVLDVAFASVDTVSGMAFSGQTANYIELIANTSTIDATAVSFEGKTGAQASVAENLAIEDKLVHKQDNAAIGLIRVKAGELFVTANSGSIQRAINNSASGDTVYVQDGT
ncbi:MAG: nitrous oxide reductase family maturation protein NosD, partial [Bacteroidota bacterium]